jgi:hypothetical protein
MTDKLAGLRRYALVRLANARAGVALEEKEAEKILDSGLRIVQALLLISRPGGTSATVAFARSASSGDATPFKAGTGFRDRLRALGAMIVTMFRRILPKAPPKPASSRNIEVPTDDTARPGRRS